MLTKDKLRTIQADFLEAMKEVAEQHGLTVKSNGGRFSEIEATLKFKVEVDSKDARNKAKQASKTNYEMFAMMNGLPKGSFDKEFKYNGQTFRICGVKARSRKRPIQAKDTHGQTFVFSTSLIKALIN